MTGLLVARRVPGERKLDWLPKRPWIKTSGGLPFAGPSSVRRNRCRWRRAKRASRGMRMRAVRPSMMCREECPAVMRPFLVQVLEQFISCEVGSQSLRCGLVVIQIDDGDLVQGPLPALPLEQLWLQQDWWSGHVKVQRAQSSKSMMTKRMLNCILMSNTRPSPSRPRGTDKKGCCASACARCRQAGCSFVAGRSVASETDELLTQRQMSAC